MGARLMGFAGLVLLSLSTILMDISHGLFSADDFASRAATSLGDERVPPTWPRRSPTSSSRSVPT